MATDKSEELDLVTMEMDFDPVAIDQLQQLAAEGSYGSTVNEVASKLVEIGAYSAMIFPYLAKMFSPEYRERWMTESHPAFGGKSPMELIEAGEGERVLMFLRVSSGAAPS